MKCATIRINPNRRRLINTSCRSTTIHWKWWAVANILESPSVKISHGESISTTHNPEQLQRRAARFVNQNYMERTPGCMANKVQSLGWESLQHRRHINKLTMLYKIQHDTFDISPDFVQEDPSVYVSYRPQTTHTSSPFIHGP